MSDYPRFSDAEMQRRRLALAAVAEERGVDDVVLYGAERSGTAVPWLTGWPVTREALVLSAPHRDTQDVLLVQFFNHVPLARQLAPAAEVRWGGPSTIRSAVEELRRRGGERQRVGVVGPLPWNVSPVLAGACEEVVDLGADYLRLRLIKSAEELDWLRTGARLSDAAITALDQGLRSGLTEHEVADMIERAYVPQGGMTYIRYIGVTAMRAPDRCVPAQFTSGRRVRRGDVLTTEISASYWGYPGQVLRTYTIEEVPTPLYQRLHDVADGAFDAVVGVLRDGATAEEVITAAGVIEDAGLTICDDLVHGFGGGYLPPVLGSRSRSAGPLPSLPFSAGMTVVVQPNVITPDGQAGVQTGELVVITDDGAERLHAAPRGLRTVHG